MSCDQNYLYPLLHTIYSAKTSSKKEFVLTVAYDPEKLDEASLRLIMDVCNVLRVDLEFYPLRIPADLPTVFYISAATYAKILLADRISDRFLYLDCDLLCLPGLDQLLPEASGLYQRFIALACPEDMSGVNKQRNLAIEKAGSRYFNAGVMIFNPRMWQEAGMPIQWRFLARNYREFGFEWADQCILNFLLCDSYMQISTGFNRTTINESINVDDQDFILHYTGRAKPWLVELNSTQAREKVTKYLESERNFLAAMSELRYNGVITLEQLRSQA